MDLGLKGKTALISGASAGIGHATAKLLAEEGVQTAIIGRREAALKEAADEIVAAGGLRPHCIVEDLNDIQSFERVRQRVMADMGNVDFLINNLGQARPLKLNSPESDWEEAFSLNFRAPRKLAECFLPLMMERKFGRIINLISTLEPSHISGSQTSKAAVLVWAKGLSRIVAKDGVTVNCITPGNLMTEQLRAHYFPTLGIHNKEDQERFIKNEIPAGHFGVPEDAANIIVFLCSSRAAYITGQQIYVDGGKHRHV